MKKREIGQCMYCKYFKEWSMSHARNKGFLVAKNRQYGECYQEDSYVNEAINTFGCWYWKEKP